MLAVSFHAIVLMQALQHRADGKLYRIQTPQTPIARTKRYNTYKMDEFPSGMNMMVAVLAYTGGCGAVLWCAATCCAAVPVLCCAVLCCAVLCCAVLCCAVLCCAVLCCAVLCAPGTCSKSSWFHAVMEIVLGYSIGFIQVSAAHKTAREQ